MAGVFERDVLGPSPLFPSPIPSRSPGEGGTRSEAVWHRLFSAMLKKIRLTDFKSFVDEEVELAPLTLLVGANASGKSNFLDAIRFLHGLSLNLTLSEILNGEERVGADRWPGIRGRAEESARIGTNLFSIESTWIPSKDREEIWHRLACSPRPQAVLHQEQIRWGTSSLSSQHHVTGKALVQPPVGPPKLVSDRKSLASDIVTSIEYAVLESLSETFEAIRFLDVQPPQMRDYGRRDAPLGNEGKNFSGVLAALCDDLTTKQSFVDWLREVCAPEIDDLDFAEVKELGDVMAIFVERGGSRISARSLSDGTLRFLGTLLALRTAQPGDLLLIEDIEEGLHPTRIQFLIEILESIVRQSEIQIIATTHSPVVLQWLRPETLRDVIAFGRVTDHEGTLMRRLGDLPHFTEVVQRKGIEELFSTGWLEMAL